LSTDPFFTVSDPQVPVCVLTPCGFNSLVNLHFPHLFDVWSFQTEYPLTLKGAFAFRKILLSDFYGCEPKIEPWAMGLLVDPPHFWTILKALLLKGVFSPDLCLDSLSSVYFVIESDY